jgi:hypothetical protein
MGIDHQRNPPETRSEESDKACRKEDVGLNTREPSALGEPIEGEPKIAGNHQPLIAPRSDDDRVDPL